MDFVHGIAPRLGIVIPCRGDVALLPACLNAMEEFLRAGDHIVVVDGDASPNVALMAQSKGTAYLCSPNAQRGAVIGYGMQELLNRRAVDLLLICHADTLLCRGTRDTLLARLGPGVRYRWGWLGHRIDDPRRRFRLVEYGNYLRGAWLNLPYGDQVMFAGVDLLAKAGGWPMQPQLEDLELSLRLRCLTDAMFVNTPATISARHWTHGICRTTIRNWLRVASYIRYRRSWPERTCI